MFRHIQRRIGNAFWVSILLYGQAAFAVEACIKPLELEADKIRFVETHLKVAALQCRGYGDVSVSALYNSFIKENRPFLVKSTKPLMTYLTRIGAGSIQRHVNKVAKRVSLESTKVSQFCERARLAAQYASKSPHPAMLTAMLPVRYESPTVQCRS